MKKSLPIVFALTLFGCGVFVGLLASSGTQAQKRTTVQSTDARLLTSALAAETGIDIACLYRLRSGKTDEVIGVLESRADSALVMLSERVSAQSRAERDPQHLQVIKMFKEYREKFPRTNSVPSVQDSITRAYGLLGDSKDRP